MAMEAALAWIPGPLEWGVIGLVVVVLFGRRLPELGRQLGRGIVEFKKGIRGAPEERSAAAPSGVGDGGAAGPTPPPSPPSPGPPG